MRMMLPLMLIYDALLRPSRFLAFLNCGWVAIGVASATVIAALLLMGSVLVACLGHLAPLSTAGIALGVSVVVGLAPVSYMLSTMLISGQRLPILLTFGGLRFCLVAIPWAVGFMGLAYTSRFSWLQSNIWALLAMMIVLGSWLGSLYAVLGTVSVYRERLAALRWLIFGCCISAIGGIRFSSLWTLNGVLIAALLLGVAAGVLRPLSYLWAALLSLILLAGVWLRIPPTRLLALHLAGLDELVLLPLPGLRTLLIRASKHDLNESCVWLLRIAQHPGQWWAAYAAARSMLADKQVAHPLLSRLSMSREGLAFLRRLSAYSGRHRPLISAYVAFGDLPLPEAWPSVVAEHWGAIVDAGRCSRTASLAALLLLGARILAAERWEIVTGALQAIPAQADAAHGLWPILEQLRSGKHQLDLSADRSLAAADRHVLLAWPGALLAAIDEHLRFLHSIEDRRAARLH